mgnify:CR=1 FL=1
MAGDKQSMACDCSSSSSGKKYVVGETMDLVLLLQNISDKEVVVPEISLMPTIANGESHPYGDKHPYNTMINFKIVDGDACILPIEMLL